MSASIVMSFKSVLNSVFRRFDNFKFTFAWLVYKCGNKHLLQHKRLTNLEKGKNYHICVKVGNSKGWGPCADQERYTSPDLPSAPFIFDLEPGKVSFYAVFFVFNGLMMFCRRVIFDLCLLTS